MKQHKKISSHKKQKRSRFKKVLVLLFEEIKDTLSSLPGKKILLISALLLAIIGGVFYIKSSVTDYVANNVVVSESEIIRRIKTHTSVPNEEPISIVRVQDAESLRLQHAFYKDVKEGNYIVVYKDKVIIYDLRGDRVVAEKNSAK